MLEKCKKSYTPRGTKESFNLSSPTKLVFLFLTYIKGSFFNQKLRIK